MKELTDYEKRLKKVKDLKKCKEVACAKVVDEVEAFWRVCGHIPLATPVYNHLCWSLDRIWGNFVLFEEQDENLGGAITDLFMTVIIREYIGVKDFVDRIRFFANDNEQAIEHSDVFVPCLVDVCDEIHNLREVTEDYLVALQELNGKGDDA